MKSCFANQHNSPKSGTLKYSVYTLYITMTEKIEMKYKL